MTEERYLIYSSIHLFIYSSIHLFIYLSIHLFIYLSIYLFMYRCLGWGGEDLSYGLGWAVRPHERNHGFGKNQTFYACHTGGAIGASSVLLIG